MTAKGVAKYRKDNPGSKLKTAVTTPPSKLKKGSKAWKRRKSFCARSKKLDFRKEEKLLEENGIVNLINFINEK